MAKITIDGLAGTGKSSTAKTLAEKLACKHFSNGDFARMQAKELGMTIYDFDELAKKDEKYDKMRDKMVEDYGRTNDDFIVEGRIGWRSIPDALKIKLTCDFDTRVKRINQREDLDFELAKKKTLQREEAIADRFLRYYDIEDAANDSHFDLIIDNTVTPLKKVIEIIEEAVKDKVIHNL